jgi:hypothetical protein
MLANAITTYYCYYYYCKSSCVSNSICKQFFGEHDPIDPGLMIYADAAATLWLAVRQSSSILCLRVTLRTAALDCAWLSFLTLDCPCRRAMLRSKRFLGSCLFAFPLAPFHLSHVLLRRISGVQYTHHVLCLHTNAWRHFQHLIAFPFPDVLVEGKLNPLGCRANGFSRATNNGRERKT